MRKPGVPATVALVPARTSDGVVVRPYTPSDRSAVRRIACETANRGEPIEPLFQDREVFADLMTRYYTDYEPQATWVVESDRRVIGYLTGCLDSRRYWRIICWLVVPGAVVKAIGRGLLWSPRTWALFRAGVRTALRGGLWRDVPLERYPAHLHLNVASGFRGRQVGRCLVDCFLRQAAAAGVQGVYASVRGDNPSACRFFERLGFASLSRHPAALPVGDAVQFHETIVYGKRLDGVP